MSGERRRRLNELFQALMDELKTECASYARLFSHLQESFGSGSRSGGRARQP